MPIWNEELQQWGYLYYEEVSSFQWLGIDRREYSVMEEKTLGNTDVNEAKKNVSDLVVFGNGDMFQLLCKASSQSQGWMKSTKAMVTPNGCVVQVTTQQKNIDGTYSVAEALTFVPDVYLENDEFGGRKLVSNK